MSIEEKLRRYILLKYGNFIDFCEASGLKNSTLSTIFKRGLMTTTTDKFFAICRTLNISADELANGRIVELNDNGISEFADKYSRLNDKSKGLVDVVMDYELDDYSTENSNILIAASGAENLDDDEREKLNRDIEMVKNLE